VSAATDFPVRDTLEAPAEYPTDGSKYFVNAAEADAADEMDLFGEEVAVA
jgi:hypothetical protein